MAYISNSDLILEWDYPKRKYLMGPILVKRKFDRPTMDFYGLCKQSKNNFGIKLLKMETWTHISVEKQTRLPLWVH